jgi:hypothetical protein
MNAPRATRPLPALRRRSVVAGAALLAGLAPLRAAQAAPEPLEPDEEALFMTGTARPTADGRLESTCMPGSSSASTAGA